MCHIDKHKFRLIHSHVISEVMWCTRFLSNRQSHRLSCILPAHTHTWWWCMTVKVPVHQYECHRTCSLFEIATFQFKMDKFVHGTPIRNRFQIDVQELNLICVKFVLCVFLFGLCSSSRKPKTLIQQIKHIWLHRKGLKCWTSNRNRPWILRYILENPIYFSSRPNHFGCFLFRSLQSSSFFSLARSLSPSIDEN